MRTSLLAACALSLAAVPSLGAQTLEERVRLLERQVAELRREQPIAQPQGGPRRTTPDVGAPVVPALPDGLLGNEHLRWGFPGGGCTPLVKEVFITCHDAQKRVPEWVTYHLTREDLAQVEVERTDDFRPDPELSDEERAELADYRGSGYDRGHMAPAADFKRSRLAMSTTFLLSNMAPQRPQLNRGRWAMLEDAVRQLANDHGSVWIYTGPLYLDSDGRPAAGTQTINGRVTVPSHFYKAVLCEHDSGTHEMFAYIMPNGTEPVTGALTEYVVTVDAIEAATGLDLFAALPDALERRLESRRTSLPSRER